MMLAKSNRGVRIDPAPHGLELMIVREGPDDEDVATAIGG